VTGTAVAAIESLRVDPVQLPDGAGETSAHGLQQKVVVIAHEAECVAANVEPFHNFFEKSKESPPIAVVVEDRKTTVSPREHVMELTRDVEPKRPRHRGTSEEAEGPSALSGSMVQRET